MPGTAREVFLGLAEPDEAGWAAEGRRVRSEAAIVEGSFGPFDDEEG